MAKRKAQKVVLLAYCEQDAEQFGKTYDAHTVINLRDDTEELARQLDLWASEAGIREFVILVPPRRPRAALALRAKNPALYGLLAYRRFLVRLTRSKWQVKQVETKDFGIIPMFYLPPESMGGAYTPETGRGDPGSVVALLKTEEDDEAK